MEHLEGRVSVLAALRARLRRFEVLLIAHDAHEEKIAEVVQAATELSVPIRRADRAELDRIAHANHGGVVAICSARPLATESQLIEHVAQLRDAPLLLLLEGIDDARNLGFTLRSADALGAHAVLIKKHLFDFDPVEVSRPASGAFERLCLARIEDTAVLERLRIAGVRIIGLIAGARATLPEVDLTRPCMLCIGGEKRGLSGAVRGICDDFATIPTVESGPSLALSHAAAVALYEAHRQRLRTS